MKIRRTLPQKGLYPNFYFIQMLYHPLDYLETREEAFLLPDPCTQHPGHGTQNRWAEIFKIIYMNNKIYLLHGSSVQISISMGLQLMTVPRSQAPTGHLDLAVSTPLQLN